MFFLFPFIGGKAQYANEILMYIRKYEAKFNLNPKETEIVDTNVGSGSLIFPAILTKRYQKFAIYDENTLVLDIFKHLLSTIEFPELVEEKIFTMEKEKAQEALFYATCQNLNAKIEKNLTLEAEDIASFFMLVCYAFKASVVLDKNGKIKASFKKNIVPPKGTKKRLELLRKLLENVEIKILKTQADAFIDINKKIHILNPRKDVKNITTFLQKNGNLEAALTALILRQKINSQDLEAIKERLLTERTLYRDEDSDVCCHLYMLAR